MRSVTSFNVQADLIIPSRRGDIHCVFESGLIEVFDSQLDKEHQHNSNCVWPLRMLGPWDHWGPWRPEGSMEAAVL